MTRDFDITVVKMGRRKEGEREEYRAEQGNFQVLKFGGWGVPPAFARAGPAIIGR